MSATSSTGYTVTSGPFKGLEALPGEVIRNTDELGREYSLWDTHARTRHFLETFSPNLGWKVHVEQSFLGMTMEDIWSRDAVGNALQNPAWLFTASLLDKDNNLVSNSSVVQLINCPMSFETGQTRARGKLYQSLGLPGSPSIEDESRLSGFTPRNTQPVSTPKVVPVADISAAVPEPVTAPVVVVAATVPAEQSAAVEPIQGDTAEDSSNETVVEPVVPEQAEAAVADALPTHSADRDPDLNTVAVMPPPAQGVSAKASAKLNGPIPSGILRQIQIRAQRSKVTVPSFDTLDQAQAFLATLVNPGSVSQDLLSGGE